MSSQTRYDAYRRRELLRLRRSLNRIQDEALLLRRDIRAGKFHQHKFNTDQPRVPAGNTGGGQWTSGSGGGGGSGLGVGSGLGGGFGEFGMGFGEGLGLGEEMGGGLFVDPTGEASWSSFSEGWSEDGSVFERDIVNRDGSTIQSEYAASREAGFDERQTVRLESGEKVSFETTDRVQTIRYDGEVVSRAIWTPGGPEPDATVQPALAGPALQGVVAGGAILFGWLSQQNRIGGQQAVMGFKANEFSAASGSPDTSWVGRITDEEVRAVCDRLPEVESRLADAIKNSGGIGNYLNAGTYGTAVHTELGRQVNGLGDRNFVAERSTLKEAMESEKPVHYGQKGTIRTDVVENVDGITVCGYDIKTGKANLTWPRAKELVGNMRALFPTASRFIIMQVKPPR